MWFRTWFDAASRPSTRRAERAADRRRAARRLFLENLEGRSLLAFNVLAEYATGPSPTDMLLAPVNAGGQSDLVVASATSPGSVRLGNADGTFNSSQSTGASARSVATGDLTGDGIADLAGISGSNVILQKGNGDGTFQAPQNISLPPQVSPGNRVVISGITTEIPDPTPLTQVPLSLVTGDLNADGKLDLVVGGQTEWGESYRYLSCGYYTCFYTFRWITHTDGYVNVLMGNGSGGFSAPTVHPLGAGKSPGAIAIGDLNGDAKADVLTANSSDLSGLLGNGTGTLAAPVLSGSGSGSISLGDLDGDGRLDLVTSWPSNHWLHVQKGLGDGRFAHLSYISLGQTVDSAVVGDVNGDGALDLVAVGTYFTCNDQGYYTCYDSEYRGQAKVVLGNGTGGFSLPTASSLGTDFNAAFVDVALADLTGDGRLDLVTVEATTGQAIVAANDGAWVEPVALYIDDVEVVEGDSGQNLALFTVKATGDHAGVTVDFATQDDTAAAGQDYTATSGTLTFAADQDTQTIEVPILGDRSAEWWETFYVMLSNPSGAIVVDGQALVTIQDNEPTVSINHAYGIDPLWVVEGDGGTVPAVFTVTLSAPYDEEITVDYYTVTGHTSDIISVTDTLHFAPGETSRDIIVQVVGDLIDEPLEAFNVYLSSAPKALIVSGAGYCYIEDNDPSPPPTIRIGDAWLAEGNSGATVMTFTVSLSKASGEGVSVNFATTNGSATTSNSDYLAQSGTIYFAPGDTTKTITVSIKGDTKREKDERFYVNLAGAIGGTIADSKGVGTILNDDDGGGNPKSNRMSSASAVDAAIDELMFSGRKKRGR